MHHPGELAVQERAQVAMEDWGSARVGNQIPPVAERFLGEQRFLVVGAQHEGRLWCTALAGPEGFIRVHDESTVHVHARPSVSDPLTGAFDSTQEVGILVMDPAKRRRMRVNGQAEPVEAGLLVRADQVYANCPKYIQSRVVADAARPVPHAAYGDRLTEAHQEWIRAADTFFVATSAPGLGTDASHRGGDPGFLQVDGRRITWPDYVGNGMYMSLGNLDLDPRAGLLFVDWESGHTLHLTGRARVDWTPERAAQHPGAQRVIDFEVDEYVHITHHLPLTWAFEEYSKFNPS